MAKIKRLIVILGPNGVGKSTASAALLKILPNSAYIDSDALSMVNPRANSDELIALQKANILAVTRNYFAADIIDDVIFPYGLHGHRKKLLDDILRELSSDISFELHTILLFCNEYENIRRMKADGRDDSRIKRALDNTREIYVGLDLLKIDVTALSPEQTAKEILKVIGEP